MSLRRPLQMLALTAPLWMCLPAAAQPATPDAASTAETSRQVLHVTKEVFSAAQTGEWLAFKALLDETMVGYASVRDGYALLVASEDQIRYDLSDTAVVVSTDFAEVKTRWERRSLSRSKRKPQMHSGSAVLQFGKAGSSWRLRAIGGDHPFVAGAK